MYELSEHELNGCKCECHEPALGCKDCIDEFHEHLTKESMAALAEELSKDD